jgi:D-3-phosphoglycerate dehydrogenase
MRNQPATFKAVVTMSISKDQMDRLQSRCEVIHTGWGKRGRRLSEKELSAILGNVNILLVGYEKVTAQVIEKAKKLQLIGCSRSNPVNVDVVAATLRGIPVIHAPGRNANAAAEFTIGLMLTLARNIARGDRALRSDRYLGNASDSFAGADTDSDITWDLDGDSPYKQLRGFELRNHTLGLIGLGAVATRVTELVQAFGMKVLTFTPKSDSEIASHLGIQRVGLEELLRQSDFISVHCKVTDETRGLLDHYAFSLTKPTAYLINTARAVVVDQEALIEALNNHRIAGAALDVFWYEPLPSNHPFLKMENVILTPHLGGATVEVPELHSKMIIDDVFFWMEGKLPLNVFNPGVLKAKD